MEAAAFHVLVMLAQDMIFIDVMIYLGYNSIILGLTAVGVSSHFPGYRSSCEGVHPTLTLQLYLPTSPRHLLGSCFLSHSSRSHGGWRMARATLPEFQDSTTQRLQRVSASGEVHRRTTVGRGPRRCPTFCQHLFTALAVFEDRAWRARHSGRVWQSRTGTRLHPAQTRAPDTGGPGRVTDIT